MIKAMNKLELESLVSAGETSNIEFKEFLNEETHLNSRRMENLSCQMKSRVIAGNGKALYVIGVTDAGSMKGLKREEFDETVLVLKNIAMKIDADVTGVEEYTVDGGLVGLVSVENNVK